MQNGGLLPKSLKLLFQSSFLQSKVVAKVPWTNSWTAQCPCDYFRFSCTNVHECLLSEDLLISVALHTTLQFALESLRTSVALVRLSMPGIFHRGEDVLLLLDRGRKIAKRARKAQNGTQNLWSNSRLKSFSCFDKNKSVGYFLVRSSALKNCYCNRWQYDKVMFTRLRELKRPLLDFVLRRTLKRLFDENILSGLIRDQ